MVLPLRDENPTRRTAAVTIALILVNVAVFFLVQLPKHSQDGVRIQNASRGDEFDLRYAAIPCELKNGKPLTEAELVSGQCGVAVVQNEFGARFGEQPVFPGKNVWLSVVFAMFMHGSILHLLGNMLFLWVFGNNVEDRLGALPYLLFYLLGGLFASATYILANFSSVVPTLGASGAIAAVMGAYLVWWPNARVYTLVFIVVAELPAVAVLGFWFVMQFFTNPNSGVAWLAHVGGFVFGALVAFAWRGRYRPRPAPSY